MEYTQENFNDDKRIATYVFYKKFSYLPEFKKDDFVQTAIISLWRARSSYDSLKGSYGLFAYVVSYHAMLSLLKKKEFKCISLYFETEQGTPLIEFIPSDNNELNFDYDYIRKTANKIINKNKSKIFRKICTMFLQGKNSTLIAKEFGKTRQWSNAYINKFRNLLKMTLQAEGYFEL